MIRYIFIDGEYGGRDIKYTLLTSFYLITDDKFNELGRLALSTKQDDGEYILNGQGMAVNKINLQEHDKIAIPYKQAKSVLYNFLKKYSDDGKVKLTPVGHGIKGDIEHIVSALISQGSWDEFCTYHYIDTSVVLQFLRSMDLIPHELDGSVYGICKHLEIEQPDIDKLHTAEYDTILTMKILKGFQGVITEKIIDDGGYQGGQ